MQLTKHHGLGNDFIVALADIDNRADLARRFCDRRRGIGADGFIVGRPGAGDLDVAMELRNADGSVAEMSGNGIRCLAQAVIRARGGPTTKTSLRIGTAAGLRTVVVQPSEDPATVQATVAMGPVTEGPTLPALPNGLEAALGRGGEIRVATADIGNPHAVFWAANPATVDLARFGAAIEAATPGGINVEFIRPTPGETDAIDLTVWERGAGITEACGTGAAAAATIAHRWGLVGRRVRVHLPGGDVDVVVGDEATLIGPATYIATIEVDA